MKAPVKTIAWRRGAQATAFLLASLCHAWPAATAFAASRPVFGAGSGVTGAQVQLMFAVPDGEAYERVLALVHDARLTAMDGEAFLVVGSFADARVGHALGLSMQRRLRLAFELVYDAHHPQADLAWYRPSGSTAPGPLLATAQGERSPALSLLVDRPLTPPPPLPHSVTEPIPLPTSVGAVALEPPPELEQAQQTLNPTPPASLGRIGDLTIAYAEDADTLLERPKVFTLGVPLQGSLPVPGPSSAPPQLP